MSEPLPARLRQYNPDLPLEQAHTIPSSWYVDEEIYQAECRHVFGTTWQVIGRLDQVAEPGSFLTANIAGEPVVAVRDEAGVLRAFYNVCRHRAATVMNEPQGMCSRLRCRYHGWTYDLQGRLRGMPEFDGVADFRRKEQGLPELPAAVWGPYVWAYFGAPPVQPLAEFLAPLPEMTRDMNLENLRFVERREYVTECNWKVFVDNYQDGGYHINTVHPGLAGAIDYTHYRTQLAEHTTVQISPLRAAEDEAIGKVRTGDAAYYWWIFPNFMVNLYSGVMDTHWVLPLGPERCKVIMDWFFPPFASPEAEQWARESIALSDTIQIEDVTISEEVQRGLRSRSYHTGRFSARREAAVYHFQKLLARYLMRNQT